MGNTARKARKKAGISFERAQKTPTGKYKTAAEREAERVAEKAAFDRLSRRMSGLGEAVARMTNRGAK